MPGLKPLGYSLNLELPKPVTEDLAEAFESLPLLELRKTDFKFASATLDELVHMLPLIELQSENYRVTVSKGIVGFRIGPNPRTEATEGASKWTFPLAETLMKASADLNLVLLMFFRKVPVTPQDVKATSGLFSEFEANPDLVRKWLRDEFVGDFERAIGSSLRRVSGIRVQYTAQGRDSEIIITYSKERERFELRTEASFPLNSLTLNLTDEIATLTRESEKLMGLLGGTTT